jgi:hypothetical protein
MQRYTGTFLSRAMALAPSRSCTRMVRVVAKVTAPHLAHGGASVVALMGWFSDIPQPYRRMRRRATIIG